MTGMTRLLIQRPTLHRDEAYVTTRPVGCPPCMQRFTSNRRQTCGPSKSARLADFRLNVVDVAFEDDGLHNSSFELRKMRAD